MKLFLLTPIEGWDPWYDSAFGFVVRAKDESQARSLASAEAGDEGGDSWLSPNYTTCVELGAEGEPGVIIRDFASA